MSMSRGSVEGRLENVETKMTKEQRLHQVEQWLRFKLERKKVEYPDETGVSKGYLKGVPGDIPADDFADIVLFCALLTNNSLVSDFKFSDDTKSDAEEDYVELKKRTLELLNRENQKNTMSWFKKTGFLSDDKKWAHLYFMGREEWGFNVGPDKLIELSINPDEYLSRRNKLYRKTDHYAGQIGVKEVSGEVEHRYFFTFSFYHFFKDVFKGSSLEAQKLRMKKAKTIIKEMIGAGLGFNSGNMDRQAAKHYRLYEMMEQEMYGGNEAKIDELVQMWREIEK